MKDAGPRTGKTGQPSAEPDAASPPPADSAGAVNPDEIDEIVEPWAYLAAMRRLDRQARTAYVERWLDLVAERPLLEQDALIGAGREVFGFRVETVRKVMKDRARAELDPTVAASLQTDELMVEMFFREGAERPIGYLVYDLATGQITEAPSVKVGAVEYVPPRSAAVRAGLVHLPSGHEDYGPEDEDASSPHFAEVRRAKSAALFAEVRGCLTRYVQFADETDATVCAAYVLMSWVFDRFNSLPYLRITGDVGVGKSRALDIVGHLAYRGLPTGGAATPSLVFRAIELFGGTLAIDEADFGDSEMESIIVKILTCGYRRGAPVWRAVLGLDKVWDLGVFDVFSPKILTVRRDFRDGGALASRCLTVTMLATTELAGQPTQLPSAFFVEALRLRNKLVLWRFRTRPTLQPDPWGTVPGVTEPRVIEIGLPVLAVAPTDAIRATLVGALQSASAALEAERGVSWEGLIVAALQREWEWVERRHGGPANILVKDLIPRLREDLSTANTTTVARIIRRQLRLRTGSTGGYPTVIVVGQDGLVNRDRLERLSTKYGVARPAD
jgi:hypothetical protein